MAAGAPAAGPAGEARQYAPEVRQGTHTDGSSEDGPGPAGRLLSRRVVVDGRVQGVGYRQACAEAARRLHVAGWVRNRRDGRVEALFEGSPGVVARMVDWCRTGPPMATVTEMRVTNEQPEGLSGFRVSATE